MVSRTTMVVALSHYMKAKLMPGKTCEWKENHTTRFWWAQFFDARLMSAQRKVRKINDRLRVCVWICLYSYSSSTTISRIFLLKWTLQILRDCGRCFEQFFFFVFGFYFFDEFKNKFQSWIFYVKIEFTRGIKWNVEKFAVVCFLWLHRKRIVTAERTKPNQMNERI